MGGVWSRLKLAFAAFFTILFKSRLPASLQSRMETVPAAPTPPAPAASAADESDRAVQMLALLQRDGRLVDFFTEDIGEYDDAQVGAAVRDMHESCRNTLNRYLTLQPVIAAEDGNVVTVDAGFDPGTIKWIGNVTGRLPVRGVLRHHGWRAGEVRLPDVPTGATGSVIAPAEVEVS